MCVCKPILTITMCSYSPFFSYRGPLHTTTETTKTVKYIIHTLYMPSRIFHKFHKKNKQMCKDFHNKFIVLCSKDRYQLLQGWAPRVLVCAFICLHYANNKNKIVCFCLIIKFTCITISISGNKLHQVAQYFHIEPVKCIQQYSSY